MYVQVFDRKGWLGQTVNWLSALVTRQGSSGTLRRLVKALAVLYRWNRAGVYWDMVAHERVRSMLVGKTR